MKFRNDIEEGSNNLFIRLKDGQNIRGIFAGEPYDFQQHWISGKSHKCLGTTCSYCAKSFRPSFRFRINLITFEDGQYLAKILEQGVTFYRQLSILSKTYNLETQPVIISRQGSTKDNTTYSVLPQPGGEISPEKADKIKAVKLNDLANPFGMGSQSNGSSEQKYMDMNDEVNPPPPPSDEPPPFDPTAEF